MKRTLTVCGRELTLDAGERYRASRPMAERGKRRFPVSVENLRGGERIHVATMSYDEANRFLAEFNDGLSAFDGRIWK